MYVELHWLDLPERVKLKLVSLVHDPTLSTDSFRRLLKTGLFQSTSAYSTLKVSHFIQN